MHRHLPLDPGRHLAKRDGDDQIARGDAEQDLDDGIAVLVGEPLGDGEQLDDSEWLAAQAAEDTADTAEVIDLTPAVGGTTEG